MSTRPVIFISAVTKELRSARAKVAATLRQLHFEPVFQEEFTSHTGVVRAVLEKELEPCAAVIQIVGHRYGWDVYDAPDPSESMSYTHYEARYAHLHHRPIWYLIISDDYEVDAPNDEDAEKKTLQAAYRVRVRRTGHLHYAVSDLKDVELTIYHMLSDLDALRPEPLRWLRDRPGDPDDRMADGEQPVSTPCTKAELETMMRGVLLEMVPALQQARQSGQPESASRREDDLYIRVGSMLGTQPDQARKELEAIASRLRADQEEPPLERAKAAYALKDYAQAEALALESARLAAQHTPPDAPEQIAALTLAGQSAQAQIHYAQAMEHYRAATDLTSQQRDFLGWLSLQNAISWLYYLQGRYPEGLTHTQTIWQAAQQAGHDEAPGVLSAHMRYASALDDNGQAAVAEPEYRAVIKVQERVLGAEHPDTLKSRMNLAIALRAQGKHAEAEQEHRAVSKIRERVLGAEHPDTLKNRMNLSITLDDQGKHAEAELEKRTVLKVQERVLGTEHPSVALSCYNLALCLEAQQKLPEALPFMQRAEQVWTQVLGPEHPHTKSAKAARERLEAAVKGK